MIDNKTEEKRPDIGMNSPILKRPIILGDLTLASPTTFTTIGANGAATALTANPVGYLTIMVGNTAYQVPYYNLA
jgi:hypothetical protein